MKFSLQAPTHLEQPSFSGHETFVLRYGWLKKAFDAAIEDPAIFCRDDAIVQLGVGKNMVRSIRHWALAGCILAEEPHSRGLRLQPTAFGMYLFGEGGRDRFLEDINSLWLVHWRICSNERKSTTWAWAFSLMRSTEFTPSSLSLLIASELERRKLKVPPPNTIKRDIDCFLRTYIPARSAKKALLEDSLDSPLVELDLMEYSGPDLVRFKRCSRRTLRDEIFTYCLLNFWNTRASDRETLSFNEIAYDPGSPGSIFKLDEDSLIRCLESLEVVSKGRLSYADTAGVKQVYRKGVVTKGVVIEEELLDECYIPSVAV